jgi:DNA-binding transcriptional MerR regulator
MTFDSSEVCQLIGVGPILLNKFVERKTYGITPSVRAGKGRGGRRLFSAGDVLGVGLVWWLFEAGLRAGVIQETLDQICETKNTSANQAAKKLAEQKTEVLRIVRHPRGVHGPGLKLAREFVYLVARESANTTRGINIEIEIPVRHFYDDLLRKMEASSNRIKGV